MSLDWSTSDCAEPLPKDEDEKCIRHALIWAAIGLDLGSITEKNVDEWVFRLWHQHRIKLDFMWLGEDPNPKELEGWVRRWVGLSTNVTTRTRSAWLKRIGEVMERDTLNSIKYYKAPEETTDADD